MPATFESLDLKFLYPDNWVVVDRAAEEGAEGVTLELPGGGFFSVERVRDTRSDEQLLRDLADSISEEYTDAEREPLDPEEEVAGERACDLRFYYLDLLIVSRLVVLHRGDARYLVQAQAESRDFDRNREVFAAMLQQIRTG